MSDDSNQRLEDEVRTLLTGGRKIEAIKVYREATGAGLAEAKDAVERIERGDAVRIASASVGEDVENQILDLLRRGRKIDAIKLYREQTGQGLKQSKEAVETLAEQRGVNLPRSGCLGAAAVLIILINAGLALAAVVW